jgi:hypothetical protein
VENLKQLVDERVASLRKDARSLRWKYRTYWGFSGFAVCLGVAAPILAGSQLLKILPEIGAWWPKLVGALALLTSVLTAIHKHLKCEEYQALCRKVLMELRGLIVAYQDFKVLTLDPSAPDKDLDGPEKAFKKLEERLTSFYEAYPHVLQ